MTAISPVMAYLQEDEKEALRALAHVRRTSVSKLLRALVRTELSAANKTRRAPRRPHQ